jgi:hypothetical protein
VDLNRKIDVVCPSCGELVVVKVRLGKVSAVGGYLNVEFPLVQTRHPHDDDDPLEGGLLIP